MSTSRPDSEPAPSARPASGFAVDPFRAMLDEMGAFVYATDAQGRYVYANHMVLDLLGCTLEQVLGKSFGDFVKLDDDSDLRATDRRVLVQGEAVAREEVNLIRATGEQRIYWSTKKPLRDAAGAIVGLLGVSYDITERKRLESLVREQKALLDAVLDNVDALVYMKGADRRFRYANQHVAEAFGVPVERIVGALDSELMPQDVADHFWRKDQAIMRTGQRSVSEEAVTDAAGRTRHYWSVAVPWKQADGSDAVIGLSTDITELHELKEELQHQARTDGLTGLANRRHFQERAQAEFERSRRYGGALSLIAIDIDHFKEINDGHGHLTGDRVLCEFARCFQGGLRAQDVCARTGGEEFCILLPDTDLTAATQLAERIHAHSATCSVLDTLGVRVSASFGVVSLSDADASFENLFARGDRALYSAKERGRNRVVVSVNVG